jgi:hemolysin activation/secretion protein
MSNQSRLLAACLALFVASVVAQEPPKPVPRFDVLEFAVEGNTVLPVVRIEKAVYPFLGPAKTVADVEAAREALERAYRDAGFATVAVDIPEQKVDDGVVVLQVVEGRIGRVRVVGARYFDQGRILAGVPALAAGEVPYLPDAQEQLAALNRSDARRVQPVLRPGRYPATTDVDLKVEDRLPLAASIELNNNRTPNTTDLRLVGTMRYDNLFQREHIGSLLYQTSPEKTSEVEVWSVAYTIPSPDWRWLGTLYYLRSNSDVAAGVGGTTAIGRGSILGARLTRVLPARGSLSRSLTLGVDYKDLDDNIIQPGLPAIPSPIQYVPLSAVYAGSKEDEGGRWQFSTGLSFAVRQLNRDELQFENKRFKAQGNFAVWRFDGARTQTLPGKAALYARVDGQLASQPLVSAEQYAAGGVRNVRGYLEATALGDNAVHGTLELRSPSYAARVSEALDDLRAVAFVEGAYLRVRDPLPQQTASFHLLSAGVGLRLRAWRTLVVSLDYGYPFRDAPFTQSGDARLQFITAAEF